MHRKYVCSGQSARKLQRLSDEKSWLKPVLQTSSVMWSRRGLISFAILPFVIIREAGLSGSMQGHTVQGSEQVRCRGSSSRRAAAGVHMSRPDFDREMACA